MKIHKTNAARFLDKAGVNYRLLAYTVDENDLSAVHLADQLGIDVCCVFKTLVLQGDRTGYFVCLIPGNLEVDIKKTARISGNKHCSLLPVKELLPVTGYIRGGCSPFGMKKHLPTFVHHSVQTCETVYVSAGQRGLQINIAPGDLIRESGATLCDLTAEA